MKSNSITYQIFSIAMALLMFFTSVGFAVDMHYCQGELKTISFFGKAKSCHEVGQGMKNCPHHKKIMKAKKTADIAANKKGCCSSRTVYIQSDQDQQYQSDAVLEVNAQLEHFLIAFVETFLNTTVSEIENPNYAHYKTPLVPRDIYVLLETYLL